MSANCKGSSRERLMLLAAGAAELSWLYAVISFSLIIAAPRNYPFSTALSSFILPILLWNISRGRGWRIFTLLLLHLVGLVLTTLKALHRFNGWESPFFSQKWLAAQFSPPGEALEVFIIGLVIFWALMLWLAGIAFARRKQSYPAIAARFDLGIAAFFFVFLISAATRVSAPTSMPLLFSFFIFSMLAISSANNKESGQRDYLFGYHGIGLVLAFAAIILTVGTGALLLFMPHLTAAAESTYSILQGIARPLIPYLIKLLTFIFGIRFDRMRIDNVDSYANDDSSAIQPLESSGWMKIIESVLRWGLLSIITLLLLFACLWVLWKLYRWLLSPTAADRKKVPSLWELLASSFAALLNRLRSHFYVFASRKERSKKPQKEAAKLYSRLLSWGCLSGLPRLPTETPWEYCWRLRSSFPEIKAELELIVEAYNQEAYGGKPLQKDELVQAHKAWKKINSPRQWLSRFKRWTKTLHLSPEYQVSRSG
ncbi:MAG: DUF4129 domain-containing protein [Dethiobacteria bacterium]|jgi:hypothetical protein